MLPHPEIEVDLASYPEFENLVAEINVGSRLTIVISREPQEDDFGVSFHGCADAATAPSYSHPNDVHRLRLSDILTAIERGRKSLEASR